MAKKRELYQTLPGDLAYKPRSVADDPRYARVKELVNEDRLDEAQTLENEIIRDIQDESP